MKIIGIDTSTDRGSVAVVANGIIKKEEVLKTRRQHSASLFSVVGRLLEDSGWARGDLEGIGAGIGPGSFTGIRVGLAGAEGLAAGLDIPLVGVVSFKAAALASSYPEGKISVLLDARRGRLYGAVYLKENDNLRQLSPPCLLGCEEAEEFCRGGAVVSPDADRLKELLPWRGAPIIETAYPEGGMIALLAEKKLKGRDPSSLSPPRPLYLSGYTKKRSKAKNP